MNAIVSLQDRDGLLAQARERDAQLARGDQVGWMHGFPQAPKDLFATQGITTTQGSPLFKDFVPMTDAIVVERAKRAGAIIIGKSNTPEFGLGSHTFNKVFGTTLNPYDLTKTAGGSSGGAAVRSLRFHHCNAHRLWQMTMNQFNMGKTVQIQLARKISANSVKALNQRPFVRSIKTPVTG